MSTTCRMILVFVFAATAAAQGPPPAFDGEACRDLAERAAGDPEALYQAGLRCEPTGDLATAATAYRQASRLGFQPATATAHLAGIFLVTGQKERTLVELRSSLEQGCSGSETHQLDFWIGEWEVRSAAGRPGHSTVQAALYGCALIEYSTPYPGGEGINVFFHDPAAGKWFHYGATGERTYFAATGEFRDGVLRLSGTRPLAHRRTLVPLGEGQLRETLESSSDGGTTWTVTRDVLYAPR